jgi:hypothetical protein
MYLCSCSGPVFTMCVGIGIFICISVINRGTVYFINIFRPVIPSFGKKARSVNEGPSGDLTWTVGKRSKGGRGGVKGGRGGGARGGGARGRGARQVATPGTYPLLVRFSRNLSYVIRIIMCNRYLFYHLSGCARSILYASK